MEHTRPKAFRIPDVRKYALFLTYLLGPEQCQDAGRASIFALPACFSSDKSQPVSCKTIPWAFYIRTECKHHKEDIAEVQSQARRCQG